jgi:hypothetical protein
LGRGQGRLRGDLGQSRHSASRLPVTVAGVRGGRTRTKVKFYFSETESKSLEASVTSCRRFLPHRARRPGPSFLTPPLRPRPSPLEPCDVFRGCCGGPGGRCSPAAAEKEGGEYKSGCKLRGNLAGSGDAVVPPLLAARTRAFARGHLAGVPARRRLPTGCPRGLR